MVLMLIACCILTASCSFGVPSYSKQLKFETGEKHLEINIKKYCTYEIGFSFSAQGGNEQIKDVFGDAMHINLPAVVDVFISNDDGQEIFSVIDFGGTELGYRYGPNPIQLIAGKALLKPGNYSTLIHVKSVAGDFSGFDSEFFIAGDPKTRCGKSKQEAND
jgi:hypothetical protein